MTRISNRDLEALSAYLDGETSSVEEQNLEARLKSEEQLRQALGELRRTRMILRAAPRVRAPRNFTLTPRMVGVRPMVSWSFPILSMASVVASLLFVLVFLGDLYTARLRQPTPLLAAQSAATESFALEAPAEESAQPMIESVPPETETDQGLGKSRLAAPLTTQAEETPTALETIQGTPEPIMGTREIQVEPAVTEEVSPLPLGGEGLPGQAEGEILERPISGALFLRIAEILLVLIALGSGAGAILLFRKQGF